MRVSRRTRLFRAIAAGSAAALVLVACGGSQDGDSAAAPPADDAAADDASDAAASAGGVPVGASLEEWQAAFEDIDPIELQFQITTGPDTPLTRGLATEYVAAVEEYSGGKITFDVIYASGAVPFATATDGVREGILDVILHAPIYEPDRYPAYALAVDLTMLAVNTPVLGQLQAYSAFVEFGFEQADIAAEFAEMNSIPIMPFQEQNGGQLLCVGDPVESLEDLAGKQIRASSATHIDEIAALGATPVSMPMTEIFEAFQRGIIDCSVITLTTAGAIGVYEIGDSWTLDPVVNFSSTPSTFSFNQESWDALPLVAQQLLWDKLQVMLEWTHWGYIETDRAVLVDSVETHGLTVHEWTQDVRDAFEDYYSTWVADTVDRAPEGVDGEAFAQLAVELNDKWLEILTGLGYADVDVPWSEFANLDVSSIDFGPAAEALWNEVYLPRRPG